MNTKHTPGPWYFGTNDGLITNAPGTPLAKAIEHAGNIDMVANARLIAAAPELLESLRNLVSDFERVMGREIECDHEAKQAISRATGE